MSEQDDVQILTWGEVAGLMGACGGSLAIVVGAAWLLWQAL